MSATEPAGAAENDTAEKPAPMSPRRRATREKLLDAAHQVFVDRGVVVSTIEEICEAAGFTRGAFYSNFTDKDDLVIALLERETDEILSALDRLQDDPSDPSASGPPESAASDPAAAPEADSSRGPAARILERFLSGRLIGRDHYLIHTELALATARQTSRSDAHEALAERQWERTTTSVRATLRAAGLEPIIDEADFAGVLYAVLERSINQAITTGSDDSDAFARRVLPIVVDALTRPAPNRVNE